ncbi:type VI secretion system amidase effector protein Tae4 [uncultured Roseobacter sp.]|uniref:type VI secretion system amidase effector protein Tae4 n=1 Tax=uncultured Roseobacter sp. TaxID=114847 RepID=UPI00262E07F1|nr:type VI secretion system amidase effector protein Tae4 [uncultured Roseobacter sp.]
MTLSISYPTLKSGYPSSNPRSDAYVSQGDLFRSIGWDAFIGNPNYHNTCAIRVSLALVRAGVKISPKSHNILKGDHSGKGVEVNMNRLANLLAGPGYLGAYQVLEAATLGNARTARQGIIAFVGIPGYAGGGHIDLIDNHNTADQCASACYFGSEEVRFWPLSPGGTG